MSSSQKGRWKYTSSHEWPQCTLHATMRCNSEPHLPLKDTTPMTAAYYNLSFRTFSWAPTILLDLRYLTFALWRVPDLRAAFAGGATCPAVSVSADKSKFWQGNQWKSMVLVLLKILRYPVVPDRVQKARKHKKIFSNFLRHFRNVRFRGEKVFPPVWSGLPATTCLADFMKSPKTLKINENQWKSMKINENSEGTGRIAGSDQQILGFRKFRKIYYFVR